jgi:hypothetical protein
MILSAAQIVKHQMISEYEMEGMWEEAITPNVKYYTSIYLEEQGKSTMEKTASELLISRLRFEHGVS